MFKFISNFIYSAKLLLIPVKRAQSNRFIKKLTYICIIILCYQYKHPVDISINNLFVHMKPVLSTKLV